MLKLLPIGTVVRLEGANIPFMIAGYFPEDESKPGYYFDYSGFPHPMGFTSNIEASFFNEADIDRILVMGYQDYVFNHDGIERIYSLGYQYRRQIEFSETLMEQFHLSKGDVSFE